MRLQDKVAVVTGAGSGLGRAIATLFAAEGATVIAGDWNGERLDEVVASISASGGSISGIRGNIADQAEAEGLIDAAITQHGRLDVLCNNAGVMDFMQGIGELSDDIWRRVLSINLDGPMFTMRRAVPQMIAQGGGSIINMSSIAGTSGASGGAAYTASKHALIGLTKSTAWMYATQRVRCNAICPGMIPTNIIETMLPDRLDAAGMERLRGYSNLIPSALEGIDIANLALFLASDESRFINGAIIAADAGWSAA